MKLLNARYRSLPWPTPKDQLFKEDSDWWHNAHLDLGGKGWNAYAAGYKGAADSLARRFTRNWRGNDILTYPMVSLYRHYLELRLKQVIVLGQKLLDEPIVIQEKILENHWLGELWKSCREILEKIGETGIDELDSIERLVKEFHTKDPDAINFRYPITKKSKGGQPTLPHLNRVSVRNLYKVMQRLDSFFTAHIDGIDIYLQEQDDSL